VTSASPRKFRTFQKQTLQFTVTSHNPFK